MRARMLAVMLLILQIAMLFCGSALSDGNCGYIEIHMTKDGDPVTGGSIAIYPVAFWNGYEYTVEENFHGFSLNEIQLEPSKAADKLLEHILGKKQDGIVKDVNSSGSVLFPGLAEGIYLVAQKDTADGYLPIRPFFVFIPTHADGTTVYGITAYPKCMELSEGETPKTGDHMPPVFLFLMSGWGILLVTFHLWRDRRKVRNC